MTTDYKSIDEAYAIFARTGPEFGGGLSNHGPMASEALAAIGRGDEVLRWAQRYRKNLEPPPNASSKIIESDWREALGKSHRVADWISFFDDALKEAAWPEVLNRWVLRLAPGIAAAAFHGVLRTAHAARSLCELDTPNRIHELAEGLGYWAATYQPLPGDIAGAQNALPSRAIEAVQRVPLSARRVGGFLTDGLAGLVDFPPFREVNGMVDTSGDVSAFISDCTETFARVYVNNAESIGSIIAFVHSVTGPRAVRNLAPHIEPETARLAARYAWQAAAGLYAAFAMRDPASVEVAAPQLSIDELVDRAVANGDEHAIKFTEACIGEYGLNRKPVYLAPATHAIRALPALR